MPLAITSLDIAASLLRATAGLGRTHPMASKRKPHAMILAAGLGTRLRPLTLDLPKPLVPIGDRSLLEHIAQSLKNAEHLAAGLNTHYLRSEFVKVFSLLPIDIRESFEPEILGTAGGVAALRSELEAPLIVYNADIYSEVDLERLSARVVEGGICLAVAPRNAGAGTVGLSEDGAIVRLRGETFGKEVRGGDYVGVLALSAQCLAELPDRGCLIGDQCLPMLRSGRRVDALLIDGKWSDIGDLTEYIKSNFAWLDESAGSATSHVGAGATVAEGVQLSRSIVGHQAQVSGEGCLERCIVWPHAKVQAPLRDAIVTHTGRIVPFTATAEIVDT
jgi:mannose-1-phosphate guanylyltransferase